jgi:restriction system protein
VFFAWVIYGWLANPSWPTNLPSLVVELLDLAEVAIAFTLALLWVGLIWRQRRKVSTNRRPALTLVQLFALSPQAFEQYVAGLFRQKGYRVMIRGGSGDHGVDLELESTSGKKAVVQCKRYRKTVSEEVVRDLYGTLVHERVAHAFLVTTAEFSNAAIEWSGGKPITLIDGNTLVRIALTVEQAPMGSSQKIHSEGLARHPS